MIKPRIQNLYVYNVQTIFDLKYLDTLIYILAVSLCMKVGTNDDWTKRIKKIFHGILNCQSRLWRQL